MTKPAAEPQSDPNSLSAIQDRFAVADVLYRYSSSVDMLDMAGVRSTLADHIWAQYGNGKPVTGGDNVVSWIAAATASIIWQHHLLNVYSVETTGDHAKALSYLTSHQVFKEDPHSAKVLVARYHDELTRTPEGWKISHRVMEVLWGESRVEDGFLDSLGGRGPVVWQRRLGENLGQA
ncbi:MAG: nuclear transport factor 2 family protein [Actinomycetota bacterium]|nr:nuclear transport factor 2 family protein [Actinomycetota bacterium]